MHASSSSQPSVLWKQPVATSQPSTVQASASSQSIATCWQPPSAVQLSVVQASASSQSTGMDTQVPASQWWSHVHGSSSVHRLPVGLGTSSQRAVLGVADVAQAGVTRGRARHDRVRIDHAAALVADKHAVAGVAVVAVLLAAPLVRVAARAGPRRACANTVDTLVVLGARIAVVAGRTVRGRDHARRRAPCSSPRCRDHCRRRRPRCPRGTAPGRRDSQSLQINPSSQACPSLALRSSQRPSALQSAVRQTPKVSPRAV